MGRVEHHLADFDSGQSWNGHLNYMTSRSNSVLSQINNRIPQTAFNITTVSPLTLAASTATVSGDGWVNVREIRVAGNGESLPVEWTDGDTWRVTLPAPPGQTTVTLEAVDFSGEVIATDTITLNNTGNRPATINLTDDMPPATTACS